MDRRRRPHGNHAIDRCSGDDHFPGIDVPVVGCAVIGHRNRSVDHDSQSGKSLRFDVDRRFVADRFGDDRFGEDRFGEDRFGEDLPSVGNRHFVGDSQFDEDLVVVHVDLFYVEDRRFVDDSQFDEDLVVVRVDLLYVDDRRVADNHVVARVERCLDRSPGDPSLTCRESLDVVMEVVVSWQAQPFVQLVRRRVSRRWSCYPVV